MDIHHYNPTLRPLYGLYVNTLCQSCWFTLKDPQELAYLAATRWPGFVSPLLHDWEALRESRKKARAGDGDEDEDGLEIEEGNTESYPLPIEVERMRLIKMFTQSFIPAASTLHPRLEHAHPFTRRNPTPSTVRLSVPFSAAGLKDVRIPGTGEDLRDLLGRSQKLLIVAAYVCGVNPAKSDSRLFVRVDDSIYGGRKKRRKGNRVGKLGAVAKVGSSSCLSSRRRLMAGRSFLAA